MISQHDGTVEYVDAREIRVRREDGALDTYKLMKFRRSNGGKNYNQRPIVKVGDHVDNDEVLADGPSMENGELALGQNPLVAFMTWQGYNFEDAIGSTSGWFAMTFTRRFILKNTNQKRVIRSLDLKK